jgi:hypothetical protein
VALSKITLIEKKEVLVNLDHEVYLNAKQFKSASVFHIVLAFREDTHFKNLNESKFKTLIFFDDELICDREIYFGDAQSTNWLYEKAYESKLLASLSKSDLQKLSTQKNIILKISELPQVTPERHLWIVWGRRLFNLNLAASEILIDDKQ